MKVEEYLQTPMTDEEFDLKLEWESDGKPVDHPFIHHIMQEYANQSKWISVEEIEPKIGSEVLFYCEHSKETTVDIVRYNYKRDYTHWQPLPQPPKQ